jgi:hypothetical protein
MRRDVSLGALPEGDRLGRFEALALPLGTPFLDWVSSLMAPPARIRCPRTGVLKAVERNRTKAHPSSPPAEHEPQNPVFGALCSDPQIQASAIGIEPRRFLLFHLQGREPLNLARHCEAHPSFG